MEDVRESASGGPRALNLGKWAKEASQRPPTFKPRKGKGKWERQGQSVNGSFLDDLANTLGKTQRENGRYRKMDADTSPSPSPSETKQSKGKEPERNQPSQRTDYASNFEFDAPSESRSKKERGSFKSRGSLVSRVMQGQDASISRNSRSIESAMDASRQKKKVKAKRINPDVMIPSIVSVGNLSRLLDVRLGADEWS